MALFSTFVKNILSFVLFFFRQVYVERMVLSYPGTRNEGQVALGLTYLEHSDTVWAVSWASDSRRVASAGGDMAVRVWQAV